MTRKGDRLATVVIVAALVQLTIGVFIVRAQHEYPEQAVVNATVNGRIGTIDTRLHELEALHLPERLAVLERSNEDLIEVRKLLYGVIATLVGSLLAQVIQINASRKKRE